MLEFVVNMPLGFTLEERTTRSTSRDGIRKKSV